MKPLFVAILVSVMLIVLAVRVTWENTRYEYDILVADLQTQIEELDLARLKAIHDKDAALARLEQEKQQDEDLLRFHFYRGVFATCFVASRQVRVCADFTESASKAKAFEVKYPVFDFLPDGAEAQ